jgi:tetratricopeptide (TPR) repeat protein
LGALLAELGEYDEADGTLLQALREYRGVSPFAIAWICFQLGLLWGELVPEPHLERAAMWYGKALDSLPGYVKARVHLAEIEIRSGEYAKAEALLQSTPSSTDPEVTWRLAEALMFGGKRAEAEAQLEDARRAFEVVLARYPLAFADHGADFYAGCGGDVSRAFELAARNVANRPTLRALEQAYAIALRAGEHGFATYVAAEATERHGSTSAFRRSAFLPSHAGDSGR